MIATKIKIDDLIEMNGWRTIPDEFTTREGIKVSTKGDRWVLPITIAHGSISFKKIKNDWLKWILKISVIDQSERISSSQGLRIAGDISRFIVKKESKFKLAQATCGDEFKHCLIKIMEQVISDSKKNHRLSDVYSTVRWYIWCAKYYSELGFCHDYASELSGMVIPGTVKGEAVRMEDPELGPLHRYLELPLLIQALKADKCKKFESLQEKAAISLSIAFGRNPANYTYLRESDFLNLAEGTGSSCYVINMPRIKKRFTGSRDDYLQEYLEDEFGLIIKELIDFNKTIDCSIEVNGKVIEIERPIFMNLNQNTTAIDSGMHEDVFNMRSSQFTKLNKDFVIRHNIISPLTKKPLKVTTRRLRYTLASGLAEEGASKKELARILDHSDTQHVHVYYEVAGSIIEHLDKATAKGFATILDLFQGNIIDSDEDAVNGNRDDKHLSYVNDNDPTDQLDIGVCGESEICHLDPPYSCYLCPKFQPYRHADHEHVLDCLLTGRKERMERYESSRLGIQLDQVISAVAQVAKICEEKESKDV